jgi:hypothetical protein
MEIKPPGPDGFPMAFFQNCWDIVHSDILEVIQYFHGMDSFEKSLNATFLTLINLVGGIYKIISKVLVNRLRMVIP